ncbi:C6 zinc finger domain protein [Rutstroemia sp. NJR-2017a BVV2]|nr:C6 zinc finger domain protein [Rutstroemia sp. NJR-2017a BVV2]
MQDGNFKISHANIPSTGVSHDNTTARDSKSKASNPGEEMRSKSKDGLSDLQCDEGRPSCQKCLSTGRKCDGYTIDLTRLSPEVRGDSIIKQVSTHLPGTREERRGFQYFVTNTAVELSGYFDSSFWEQLILQASVAEPSLRHAVIGLGALHEDFSNRHLDMETKCDAARTACGFATDQYTKAIGHLRRSLSCRKQKPLTALMSCIMFVCFESLRGHFSSAIIHLESGLKILHNSHLKSSPEDEKMIEDHIVPIFMRLCIQAVLYIDTQSEADRTAFALSVMTISKRKNVIAEEFPNLEAARRSLNQTAEGLFGVFYMCDGSVPMAQQPAEAIILYEQYRHELNQWIISFENLMKHKSARFNSKQLRGAAMCKLHYIIVNIMARVSIPDSEDLRSSRESSNDPSKTAKYENEFWIVVSLARSLINAAEQDVKEGKPPLTFSTDSGLVAPLYYTCVKCTNKSIREQAMELLRRIPRKEGMWDSPSTIRLIEGFWELERKHAATLRQQGNQPVAMSQIVHLVVNEGMRWEWKVAAKGADSEIRELCMPKGSEWDELHNLDEEALLFEEEWDLGFWELRGGIAAGLSSAWAS